MRTRAIALVLAATLLAVGGAIAYREPWQAVAAAAALSVAWTLLVFVRPASRLHVLPMSMGVGLGALLAVGPGRLAGIAGITLALFAWDATVLLRAATRFSSARSPRTAAPWGYAFTATGVGAVGLLAYVIGETRPLRVTFPIAFALSIVVLSLWIALLWVGRKVEPARNGASFSSAAEGEGEGADDPRGSSAPIRRAD